MTRHAAALLACLVLCACRGDVRYRGPSVQYQGPAHPVALVAVGAVMVYELGLLAAPAFHCQGAKPRSRAVEAQAAQPAGTPDTLVLLTLDRGPAQALSLADLARGLRQELEGLGILLADSPGWSLDDPDAFRYARLAQRGLARVVLVGLDASPDGSEAVARLALVDVAGRERLEERVLRRAVAVGEKLAGAHAALAPLAAQALAEMLAGRDGPEQPR